MGVPLTCSSRTKTARPSALWPVTTVRTFSPCLLSSGLFMVTFLDRCNLVFIFNFLIVEVIFCKCLTKTSRRSSTSERTSLGLQPAQYRCRQDVFNDQILLQHWSVITSHWPIC